MQKVYSFKIGVSLTLLMAMQLVYGNLSAQNLIKNPSFEDYKVCPSEFGCLEEAVPSWYQPTYGSTDYFNSCSPDNMSSEENFIGVQSPFDGHGYAGLYAYAPKDYREYLTAELREPLKRGQKYVFSFQVSLAEESHYGVNEFGILFTQKSLDLHTKRNIPVNLMSRKKYYNYTIVRNHEYFNNKNEWTEVTGIYIADGSERFMTIGNFNANSGTRLKANEGNLKKVAYYYVDMVSVSALSGGYALDEIYVLENLNFEVNGYTLNDKVKAQLQPLIEYLKAHRGYVVSIYGHTDDLGSKEYNRQLSQKRAKAVALFLKENGLSPHRIVWKGFGDLSPVAKNETEEGRSKNRRVEFVLSRKKRDYFASSVFEDEE